MIQGQSRSTVLLRSIQHLLRMNSNLVSIQMGAVRGCRYYSKMKKKSFKPDPCNYLSNLSVNTVRLVIFMLHRLSDTKAWMLAVLR